MEKISFSYFVVSIVCACACTCSKSYFYSSHFMFMFFSSFPRSFVRYVSAFLSDFILFYLVLVFLCSDTGLKLSVSFLHIFLHAQYYACFFFFSFQKKKEKREKTTPTHGSVFSAMKKAARANHYYLYSPKHIFCSRAGISEFVSIQIIIIRRSSSSSSRSERQR